VFGDGRKVVTDEKAEWKIRNQSLYKIDHNVKEWLLIEPPRCTNEVDKFLKSLRKVSSPLGVTLKDPEIVTTKGYYAKDFEECIKANLKTNNDYKFILIILPDPDKYRYDQVKKLLCLNYGILSQCITLNNLRSAPGKLDSIATKLAIQIATKIGSVPWTVEMPLPGPTMICGMDVYHSGEKVTRTKSSIVGFTANVGGSDSSYYSRVLINKPGKELVDSLEPCLEGALAEFKKKNGVYPKHVIFYRDGVGEGQVQEVKDKEVASVNKIISKVGAKLCFIVVLKRIHTRIFKKDGDFVENPAPGTVVDTGITEPGSLEFFMVSQNVNQGTATPVKYQCIHNSSKLGPSYLQLLTFKLTHLYYNWFGTVKVPAPCLYAHRLAFLVGQSLEREDDKKRLCSKLYYL
jgi:aubergine-like protein